MKFSMQIALCSPRGKKGRFVINQSEKKQIPTLLAGAFPGLSRSTPGFRELSEAFGLVYSATEAVAKTEVSPKWTAETAFGDFPKGAIGAISVLVNGKVYREVFSARGAISGNLKAHINKDTEAIAD
jgi:hypothetical protein